MLTLQMRTPVYDAPELVPRDTGVIIGDSCLQMTVFVCILIFCHSGISVGLGASMVFFLIVAIFIRVKRKMKASTAPARQRLLK
jgi:hypothetical protein